MRVDNLLEIFVAVRFKKGLFRYRTAERDIVFCPESIGALKVIDQQVLVHCILNEDKIVIVTYHLRDLKLITMVLVFVEIFIINFALLKVYQDVKGIENSNKI